MFEDFCRTLHEDGNYGMSIRKILFLVLKEGYLLSSKNYFEVPAVFQIVILWAQIKKKKQLDAIFMGPTALILIKFLQNKNASFKNINISKLKLCIISRKVWYVLDSWTLSLLTQDQGWLDLYGKVLFIYYPSLLNYGLVLPLMSNFPVRK